MKSALSKIEKHFKKRGGKWRFSVGEGFILVGMCSPNDGSVEDPKLSTDDFRRKRASERATIVVYSEDFASDG